MIVEIWSDKAITADVSQKIRDIFRESQCPAESIKFTFDGEAELTGETVYFGDKDKAVYHTAVET